MNAKPPIRRAGKNQRTHKDRDLAVLATLGVKVRCSPSPDYVHPLALALAAVIRQWLRKHRFKAAGVMRRARLSRETLRKLMSEKSWYSVNVAARICDAMGLDFGEAVLAALRRCGRRK